MNQRAADRNAASSRGEFSSLQDALHESLQQHRSLLDLIPVAVYACDAEGVIRFYNRGALELWGQEPRLGDTDRRFCGSWRLFTLDGKILPHDETPMAQVLRGAPAVRHHEVVMEKPNGQRTTVSVNIDPIRDEAGRVMGAVNVFQDVSDQKRLEETRRLLAAIVECSADAIFSVALDGTILSWNGGSEKLFGYQAAEMVGRPVELLVPTWKIEELQAMRQRIRRGESVTHQETTRLSADGRLLDVSLSLSPIGGHNNQIIGWATVARDISAQRQAKEALRRRVEEVQALFQALPVGVFIADDPECRRITGNSVASSMLRLEPHANLSKTAPPSEQPAHFRLFRDGRELLPDELPVQKAARGLQVRDELVDMVFDDGSVTHALVSAEPLFDSGGRVRGAVAGIQDITHLKQVEVALRKKNERLQLLSEAAGYLLTVTDAEAMMSGLFDRVRAHLETDAYFIFVAGETGGEWTLASCAGIPAEAARSINQVEFGAALDCRDSLPEGPVVASHIQTSDDPRSSRIRPFGIRAYAGQALTAGGRLLGTLVFASRTRDRFQADEIEFLSILSQYVAAAYDRVRLIGQLREADRRKDEFLAILAHELRNPLAPIRTSLQILQRQEASPSISRIHEIMNRQVGYMVRLVDDLMEVSRITRGDIVLLKETVDLAEVIRSAVETSSPLLEDHRHRLSLDLPPGPILLDADPVRLAQVFANLLNNAARYTPPGGEIQVGARREKGELIVSVRDNGIGIPDQMLARIFDMFARGERSSQSERSGLGIGLTLVRSLVELHGGRVEVTSGGPGEGSEFTVRLPAQPHPAEIEPETSETAPLTNPRRILVVDDNVDAAESLRMLLECMDHKVEVAHTGGSVTEAARGLQPDVIFLDIGLPDIDGYEVARRVRQEPDLKDIYLVAITGYGQESDRRRSSEAGFDQHLVKPVDPETFEKLLASLGRG